MVLGLCKLHLLYLNLPWSNLFQCGCMEHAAMGVEMNLACPGCQHVRCERCPFDRANILKHVEIPPLLPRSSWLSFCRHHTSQINTCDLCKVAAKYGVDCPVE
jgi:hypothetical protein